MPNRLSSSILAEKRATWEAQRVSFQGWLDQTPEEALEPDLPIIDTHHHLWDYRGQIQGGGPHGIAKQHFYMTDQLLDDCIGGGHNITHTVYMEAYSFHSADVEPAAGRWRVPSRYGAP